MTAGYARAPVSNRVAGLAQGRGWPIFRAGQVPEYRPTHPYENPISLPFMACVRLTDPLVVFVAHGVGYSEVHWLLRSLDDRGLLDRLLLVISGHYFSVHPSPCPPWIDDDGASEDRTVARIEDWVGVNRQRIGGVVGVDEERQFGLSRRIAERFSAPFASEETCARASNKILQKVWFGRNDVPTPAWALVSSADDPGFDRVPYPAVVKAISGYGSQFMSRCLDADEARAAYSRWSASATRAVGDVRFEPRRLDLGDGMVDVDTRTEFLLERWVGGTEFSCEFMVRGGGIELIRVAQKVQGAHFGFFDGTLLLSRARVEEAGVGMDRLASLCARVALSLDASSGVCMVDFLFEDGELVVLEASIRSGLSATNHMMFDLVGYSTLALSALEAMGRPEPIRFPTEDSAVVYLRGPVSPDRFGTLRRAFGDERVYLYAADEEPSTAPADDVDPTADLSGYVVVRNPGHDWERTAGRVDETLRLPSGTR